MIRPCTREDRDAIHAIVNDAARAYQGVIPEDRWKEPYMPMQELIHEIDAVRESSINFPSPLSKGPFSVRSTD